MSKRHGAREQKRLAKKKAKQQARRRNLARRSSSDPTIRLKEANEWPVSAALVPETLWTDGIGNLLLVRRMPDGRLACGFFLVDVFCLGVKDAHWKILTTGELNDIRKKLDELGRLRDTPPEYFAKLVYRAADYAQSLGFPPHRDFRHSQRLLAGIDPSLCPDEFEFGQDGRPHYIRGPSESLDKARSIAQRVQSVGGHYTLGPDAFDLDDMEYLDGLDDEFEADEFDDDEFDDDEFRHPELEAHECNDPESSEDAATDEPQQPYDRGWWPPWR